MKLLFNIMNTVSFITVTVRPAWDKEEIGSDRLFAPVSPLHVATMSGLGLAVKVR